MRLSRGPGRSSRRGFWRAQDGATAVEFGFIAFPFCLLVFATIEIALVFTVDSVLDNATIETGRLVRTGQAAAANMTAADFKDSLCDRMSIFAPQCRAANVTTVDVQVVTQFDTQLEDPSADGDLEPSDVSYTNGAPGSLMLVRVWYRQPLVTGFLMPGMTDSLGGDRVLRAATAFRNEP